MQARRRLRREQTVMRVPGAALVREFAIRGGGEGPHPLAFEALRMAHGFARLRVSEAPGPIIQRQAGTEAAESATESKPVEAAEQPAKPESEAVPAAQTADARGSTVVEDPPAKKTISYSGTTLSEVAKAIPEEAGSCASLRTLLDQYASDSPLRHPYRVWRVGELANSPRTRQWVASSKVLLLS